MPWMKLLNPPGTRVLKVGRGSDVGGAWVGIKFRNGLALVDDLALCRHLIRHKYCVAPDDDVPDAPSDPDAASRAERMREVNAAVQPSSYYLIGGE